MLYVFVMSPSVGVEPNSSNHRPEDSNLVRYVRADPERRLARLYERFARDVNRIVFRLLGPDPEHDDIVQQIFLHMIQSLESVRDPARLSYWVKSICCNVVRSELRKRMVRRAFLRLATPAESGDLTHDVESADMLARSSEVLDRFPTQERTVLTLYYLEEYSLPEIADVCGFSTMTAKRRLSKARERFKKQMTRGSCAQ
jgi:RNA polymerase sigma-70 factor (ECF subfamily)